MAEALVLAGRVPDLQRSLRAEGLRTAARFTAEEHGRQLEAALAAAADAGAGTARPALRLVATPTKPSPTLADDLGQRLQAGARNLRDRGDLALAARFAAAACCLAPADRSLQRELAELRHAGGDHAGALAVYDQLVAQGVDDAELQSARGHVLHALGRMNDAAQAFRAALALGDRSADAYNRLGVVLYQAGDVHGARQNFERALVLQPSHPDALANLAALPAA
jgi:Flp pilus assembly protein TadD